MYKNTVSQNYHMQVIQTRTVCINEGFSRVSYKPNIHKLTFLSVDDSINQ